VLGALGENARIVLSRVAFHIGVPALMLLNLAEASLDQIVSAATAGVSTRLCLWQYDRDTAVILFQVAVMAPIGMRS
jgi:hypothetical protein